jgi:hypothetical protein
MRIRSHGGTGTAFLYRNNAGNAFLTAAHSVEGAAVGDLIHFEETGGWNHQQITAIRRADGFDACAFSVDSIYLGDDCRKHPESTIKLGDELLIVGFPHDLSNTFPGYGLTTPLVRAATFSGIIRREGIELGIIDCFNNPGYSGAPVYAYSDDGGYTLFGLISGYRIERPSHGRIIRKLPDGGEEVLPDLYAQTNSGMTQCVMRGVLDELIDGLDAYLEVRPQ